jgi:hypothetical protein
MELISYECFNAHFSWLLDSSGVARVGLDVRPHRQRSVMGGKNNISGGKVDFPLLTNCNLLRQNKMKFSKQLRSF